MDHPRYDSWKLATPWDNESDYCSCCGENQYKGECKCEEESEDEDEVA